MWWAGNERVIYIALLGDIKTIKVGKVACQSLCENNYGRGEIGDVYSPWDELFPGEVIISVTKR